MSDKLKDMKHCEVDSQMLINMFKNKRKHDFLNYKKLHCYKKILISNSFYFLTDFFP